MSCRMRKSLVVVCVAAAMSVGISGTVRAQSQELKAADPIEASEVPRRKQVAPLPPRGTYKPVKTSWGDPDIAGAYNNSDETGIPFERPEEFAGRTLDSFTPEELAKITQQRQAQTIERNPDAQRVPRRHEPNALVRELLCRQQPRVAGLRSAGRQSAAADR